MRQTETFTISSLARNAGVGIQTVRFYERKGLIKQPIRLERSYRQYSTQNAKQIQFIKRAQDLGFTLKEIKGLIELQTRSKSACPGMKSEADKKIIEIKKKIEDLRRMLNSLGKISDCCSKENTTQTTFSLLDCFDGKC